MIEYCVKSGDTLSQIAVDHGTSVAVLQSINNIPDANIISVNQVLYIPEGDPAASLASDNELYTALNNLLIALENLPEYQAFVKLWEKR